MKVEQIYTNCIAEAAYYIESDGEAAVIDPLREWEPYANRARADKANIRYIFETHFHADFVSGHLDLAKQTGATIVYGPTAKADFDILVAKDNQEFKVGRVRIKLLHTPGHTMESSSLLLYDENGKEHALLTGDTLFLGDAGRPDLAVKTDLTQEQLASYLYDSLRNKIMPLPDNIIIYPGHGAGSACGKALSKDTSDTLGNQKKTNYTLRADMSKEEFIRELTTGLLPPPKYFPKNALMNKKGYESVDAVIRRGDIPLMVEEFEALMKEGAIVLDVRSVEDFRKAHIPSSIFIGLDGSFAMWVGSLIDDIRAKIILVVPQNRSAEAVLRLSRIGYDNACGYLNGGVDAWKSSGRKVESLNSVTASEFTEKLKKGGINIVDVRKHGEFEAEHVVGAVHFPLDYINEHLGDLDKSKSYYIHCGSGYRSVAAASVLMKAGYTDLIDVKGGMQAILGSGAPVTEFACQA